MQKLDVVGDGTLEYMGHSFVCNDNRLDNLEIGYLLQFSFVVLGFTFTQVSYGVKAVAVSQERGRGKSCNFF